MLISLEVRPPPALSLHHDAIGAFTRLLMRLSPHFLLSFREGISRGPLLISISGDNVCFNWSSQWRSRLLRHSFSPTDSHMSNLFWRAPMPSSAYNDAGPLVRLWRGFAHAFIRLSDNKVIPFREDIFRVHISLSSLYAVSCSPALLLATCAMTVSLGIMCALKSVVILIFSVFLLTASASPQQTLSVSSTDIVSSPSPVKITGSPTSGSDGTPTSFKPRFTVPSAADIGATLLPNSMDPKAKDAQTLCPGYNASDVITNSLGFSATLRLAGEPCNVYGNDIETLNLTVEYQSADRLAVAARNRAGGRHPGRRLAGLPVFRGDAAGRVAGDPC